MRKSFMEQSAQKNWYLLTCKPHKDAIAEAQLINQGFEVYRPLAQRLRKRRGKMVQTLESLFPRYLFVRLDTLHDHWAPIRSTRGVQHFVRAGDQPLSASNTLIDAIKQQEQQLSAKAIDLDKFHKNEAVLLTDGPFKALNGIFLSYDGDQRAIILLEILNCPTKLTISPANLVAA